MDVMIGGAGDDSYVVDNLSDYIIEAANGGNDTVYSSAPEYRASDNVEQVRLLDGAISAIGNSLNNTLYGNSGSNFLAGQGGVDTMFGGDGQDEYSVDNVNDVIVEGNGINSGFDFVYSTASEYTLSANVELLFLTDATALKGYGNESSNYIGGNSQNNTLIGFSGSDTLYGNLGKDTYDLSEAVAASDVVLINAGDSLVGSFDVVYNFTLGGSGASDILDLNTRTIAANVSSVNGVDSGTIRSHSISNGIISFDALDSFTTPLAISSADLTNVFGYLQTNITGGDTVAFISEGNTYLFQDGFAQPDTLVELVGVSAGALNTFSTGGWVTII
jgi:Ca2+-binding RTX toxin-like protein